MLALIGTSRFETLIRRLLSTKGSEASPLLSPEIQPVIVVEDFGPELYALRNDRLVSSTGFSAAVAALSSVDEVFNPVGSSVVVVIESYKMWTNALFPWGVWLVEGQSTLANVVAGFTQTRDGRLNVQPVATVRSGTIAALPAGGLQVDSGIHLTNLPLEHNVPIVLAPGQSLLIGDFTVNQGFNVNVYWRERSLEQSELSL